MSTPVNPGSVRRHGGALTAKEARATAFRQSQLAWRGYSEDDVNDFVQRAANALEMAERDQSALRAEIDRLRSFYRDHGTDVDRAVGQPRPRRPQSWLVREADRYTDSILDLAAACADSTVEDDAETSEQHLYHARVRARLLVEDLISAFVSDPHNRSRAGAELLLLTRWMRGFGEAILAQVDAMVLVADRQVRLQAARR
jgi:DivIVA domain-containing protein